MNSILDPSLPATTEANIKSILEWLALAHGHHGSEYIDQLLRQLLLLRETPAPNSQRAKLLDLLYTQAERIVTAELPLLHEVSLPISRRLRLRVRLILELLETLTQDYFNTLSELFDPLSSAPARLPQTSLRRAMHCISWQIKVNHLVAAPSCLGLWQQLHAAYGTARRLGIAQKADMPGGQSIERIYMSILLAAIAQPASFHSAELEFITQYIEQSKQLPTLSDHPPEDSNGVFWIDLDKDIPAHALVRRSPGADTQALYFSCRAIAQTTLSQRNELNRGRSATELSLPEFAESHAGRGTLLRLGNLWGEPAKRRFPRRRQSYRANLCSGLEQLWQLSKSPSAEVEHSEWMVTNESPDGYALMHITGDTDQLKVGDIVALQSQDGAQENNQIWRICIIRWAISENPEHIELGLQLLASSATAAEIFIPDTPNPGRIAALMLPETPPLRPHPSLVVPTDTLTENSGNIIVLIENKNLEIRQVRTSNIDEQTSSIEVFSVFPDESS